jgi:hypothetical protein
VEGLTYKGGSYVELCFKRAEGHEKKVKKVLGLGVQGLRLRPLSTPRSLEDRYYDADDYYNDYNDVP